MISKPVHSRYVLFIVVLSASFLYPLHALMIEYSLTRLVAESSHIVTGKVITREARWNDTKSLIFTDVRVSIHEVIKAGEQATTITIRIPGGAITEPDGTGIGMGRSDVPEFSVEEEVLLFLHRSGENETYSITGQFQGKLTITADPQTGKKHLHSQARALVHPTTMKIRHVDEYRVPLEDMIRAIKSEIASQAQSKKQ